MEKKILREEALSLEGDGIIPKLYNLLSCKDPVFGTMPTIFLPDTILFTFNVAERWYFGNEKGVRRKLKANCTLENIEKVFLKHPPKHGIVAQYIAFDNGFANEPPNVTFMYIKKDEFRTFLHGNKPNGILQRFVTPKSTNNFILKLNWSPNFAVFEKYENIRVLNDEKFEVYERCVTIEGKDYQIRKTPVRGHTLPRKLGKLGNHIFQHIKNASGDNIRISRMSLVFKIDEEGTLYFLYCTSLRIQAFWEQQENQRPFGSAIKPENTGIAITSPLNGVPQRLKAYDNIAFDKKNLCQSCDKGIDDQETLTIPFSQVIIAFNTNRRIHNAESTKLQAKPTKRYGVINFVAHRPEEIKVIDPTIPKIIIKLYPDITRKTYESPKKEPGFLYQTINVCQECYLVLSRSYDYVKEYDVIAREFETFNPKGTGKLRPETLQQRRTATATNLRSVRAAHEPLIPKSAFHYSTMDEDVNSSLREKSLPAVITTPKSLPPSLRPEKKFLKRILHANDSPPPKNIREEGSPIKEEQETNLCDNYYLKIPARISLANTAYNVIPWPKKILPTQISEPYMKSFYLDKKTKTHDKSTFDNIFASGSTINSTKHGAEIDQKDISQTPSAALAKHIHPLLRPSHLNFFKKVAGVKYMEKQNKTEKLNSFNVMLEDSSINSRSRIMKGYKVHE